MKTLTTEDIMTNATKELEAAKIHMELSKTLSEVAEQYNHDYQYSINRADEEPDMTDFYQRNAKEDQIALELLRDIVDAIDELFQ